MGTALVGMGEGPLVAPATDDTVVTLRELTGQQRTIRLSGRALPFAPMTEKFEHTVAMTKIPGSSERTAHVLGFNPGEQDWEGRWDTRYMNGAPLFEIADTSGQLWQTVNTAMMAHAILLDVLCQGQQVEVSYGASQSGGYGVSPYMTLRGFVTRVEFPIHNWWVIEFKVHFEWTSLGAVSAPSAGASPPDTSSWADKATAAMNAAMDGFDGIQAAYDATVGAQLTNVNNVLATANAVVAKVDGLYNGIVLNTLQQIATMQQQIATLANEVETLAGEPADMARSIAILAGNVWQTAWDIETNAVALMAQYREAGEAWQNAYPPSKTEFLPFVWNSDATTSPDSTDTADQEVTQIQSAMAVAMAMRDLLTECQKLKQAALKYANPTLKCVYPVKDGDSLRSVSVAQYGVPDNWLQIAAANGLLRDDLSGVQYLKIPAVT